MKNRVFLIWSARSGDNSWSVTVLNIGGGGPGDFLVAYAECAKLAP